MNLEGLKIGFLAYLQEKLSETNKDDGAKSTNLNLNQMNIFMYQAEFEEYLKEEVGIDDISELTKESENGEDFDIDSLNQVTSLLSDLQNTEMNIQNFATGNEFDVNAELLNQENSKEISDEIGLDFINDIGVSFTENEENIISGLFGIDNNKPISQEEQEKVKNLLSVIDGKEDELSKEDLKTLKKYIKELEKLGFSEKEIIKNIMGLDGDADGLSANDLKNIAKEFEDGSQLQQLKEAAEEGIQPNDVMEQNGAGDSSSYQDPGGVNTETPKAPAIGEKNLDNMSIEELEKELENSKAKVQESEKSYLEELEKTNADLANNIKTAKKNIEDTNSKLTEKDGELQKSKSNITTYNSDLTAARTKVGDIDSQINQLKNSDKEEGSDTTNIDEQIRNLEDQKETLIKETIPSIEDKIKSEEKLKEELEKETIPTLEDQLKKYQDELATYEKELASVAQGNPSLKSKVDEYNKAKDYQSSIEAKLETRRSDKTKEEQSNRPDKSEAPKDYRGKEQFDFTNLPMTYTLGGKQFHCVGFEGYDTDGDGSIDFKPDSWEEVQRYFANGGVANIGKFGSMQCHNYSDMLGQFVMGDANMEFVQALYGETNDPNFGNVDRAGEMAKSKNWNTRTFAKCDANNRDEERAIIENELQNGRPVVVSVPYSGGSHYVLAVGISDDGDIMIWDSYNGTMEVLGRSSDSDQSKRHRNMASSDGVMVYADGYYYDYNRSKAINYWEYVGATPEYVMKHGYR